MFGSPEFREKPNRVFIVVDGGQRTSMTYDQHLDTQIDGVAVQGFSLGALRRKILSDFGRALDKLPDDTYLLFTKEDSESAQEAQKSFFDDLITLDCIRREIRINDIPQDLSRMEYKMFEFFLSNPGITYSIDQLHALLWDDTHSNPVTVRIHIKRVRDTLSGVGLPADKIIVNKKGIGYLFDDRAEL